MAPARHLDRPIQLRHEEEDEDKPEESEHDVRDGSSSEGEEETDRSQPQSEEEEAETAPSSGSEATGSDTDNEEPSLADISFGALAKVQQSFEPKPRKRKFEDTQDAPSTGARRQDEEPKFDTRKRSKEARIYAPRRTSKHAPTVESARKPVSRKRVIFEPSTSAKSRDPRFDPTVMSSNRDPSASNKANKNYSFLSQYQAEEILQLKDQIKKAKDPDAVTDLKRQVMSMESKIRNAEARQREIDIRKKHKEKEKEALRSGQKSKPYFLKEADVRKLAKEERLQGMGKKARDKADKRRQKREKGKESRDMPRVRRER